MAYPTQPTLPPVPWLQAAPLQRLMTLLNTEGAATRLVGGCVRNALLGLPVTDIDLATTLPPAAVMERLSAAGIQSIPTGLAHGTVTAVVDHQNIEITTLRIDVTTDGRRAEVAFTDDWQADAARRDLTLNALYADADGTVFDPLGGLEDVRARRVRFIGDPAARIREDALRILRFFRFVACLQPGALPLDPAALAACRELAVLLETLSGERIQKEMLRLLTAPSPPGPLRAMADCGILERLSLPPALSDATETWLGQLCALEGDSPSPLRRLCVLADGQRDRLAALAAHWKLSRRDADHLTALARIAAENPALDDPVARWLLLDAVPFGVFADALTLFFARRAGDPQTLGTELKAILETATADKHKPFPLSGYDLMARGIPAGPQLGELLHQGRRLWAASGFTLQGIDILDKISKDKSYPS